jgi:hypothetical protein
VMYAVALLLLIGLRGLLYPREPRRAA